MASDKIRGYAVFEDGLDLKPYEYEPRPLGEHDVEVRILYSGICHSDLHAASGEWGKVEEPMIVGHEIVGEVVAVGSAAKKHVIGTKVGLGPQVLSCRSEDCGQCSRKLDQYCASRVFLFTPGLRYKDGKMAQGGYARGVRAHEGYVHAIPEALDLKTCAPLLCAGVTTFKPMVDHNVGPGKRVAVVGVGGLGHMAIQWAAKMGAEVTAVTSSTRKTAMAKDLGAKDVLCSSDPEAMAAATGRFHLVVMTASAALDWNALFRLVCPQGVFHFLGAPGGGMVQLPMTDILFTGLGITGSLIGSPHETEQMLAFAAKHGVAPWTELVPLDDCASAVHRVMDNKLPDRVFRIVLDVKDGSDALSKM